MENEILTYLITSLILEYRLSLDTISELFNIDKKEIYNRLMEIKKPNVRNAMVYILNYETKEKGLIDQKEARKNATMFLLRFKREKDTKSKLKLINSLNDITEIERIASKKHYDRTEEEINKIIKYRYKYCISLNNIEKIFDISRKVLSQKEKNIEGNFKDRLELLSTYSKDNYFNTHCKKGR